MVEFLTGMNRTHMCGELTAKNIDEEVTLMGWANRGRDLGGLIFVQLRDRTGVSQIVFDINLTDKELFEKASTIKMEYVLAINEMIRKRFQSVWFQFSLSLFLSHVRVHAHTHTHTHTHTHLLYHLTLFFLYP